MLRPNSILSATDAQTGIQAHWLKIDAMNVMIASEGAIDLTGLGYAVGSNGQGQGPGGGGMVFGFSLVDGHLLCDWTPIEAFGGFS